MMMQHGNCVVKADKVQTVKLSTNLDDTLYAK